jgi:hypothetical protein
MGKNHGSIRRSTHNDRVQIERARKPIEMWPRIGGRASGEIHERLNSGLRARLPLPAFIIGSFDPQGQRRRHIPIAGHHREPKRGVASATAGIKPGAEAEPYAIGVKRCCGAFGHFIRRVDDSGADKFFASQTGKTRRTLRRGKSCNGPTHSRPVG